MPSTRARIHTLPYNSTMAEERELTPLESASITEADLDLARKRKSKSPSLAHENKRLKEEDVDVTDDIAKQYKRFKAAAKYNLNSEELYCICRKPDHGGELMVGCDGCEEWFHFKCMKINPQYKGLISSFYCKFCQWRNVGQTRWNKKCRRPGCFEPISKSERSKYCSEECGLRFLRSKLQGSDVLPQDHIKFVLSYNSTYEDLTRMGIRFPELPEVELLDMEKLPLQIRTELTEIDAKVKKVLARHELVATKVLFLPKIKEKIRIVNEKLQQKLEPEEDEKGKKGKKKSKAKKIDLCCFEKGLDSLHSKEEYESIPENVYEAFKADIDEVVRSYSSDGYEEYKGELCLQDRRKCLRHNGWLGLLTDRLWKIQSELESLISKLEQYKADTLRNYSIQKYEEDN